MFRDLLHFFVGCFVKRHKINPDFSLGILYRYFFPGLQLTSVIDVYIRVISSNFMGIWAIKAFRVQTKNHKYLQLLSCSSPVGLAVIGLSFQHCILVICTGSNPASCCDVCVFCLCSVPVSH